MNIGFDEIFKELAPLPRWVPYQIVWNEKRQKYDKIPYNGTRKLFTTRPDEWGNLEHACELAKHPSVSGVGLVLTSGITYAGWRLIGLDYDQVDFANFKPMFRGYTEKSPSGTGVRAFAWVPEPWAVRYKDTQVKHPYCDHCEIYLGTAPRFLTVTFDTIDEDYIPSLKPKASAKVNIGALEALEKLLKPAEAKRVDPPKVETEPINFSGILLSKEHQDLLAGCYKGDRSSCLHGLLIQLIDAGKSQAELVATIISTPALWQYCLSHRNNDPDKAAIFAEWEVSHAYKNSLTSKRDALVGFNKAWADPTTPDEDEEEELPQLEDLTFPEHLFDDAQGLVGEIAHWIYAASYAPRKEFSYACALSMVATMIGPYCTQGTRGGILNLYIALIGGTGTGKNEAFDNMARLLAETDAKDCILGFPASEAALRQQLVHTPNILLRVDELAHRMKLISQNENGLAGCILEAYNGTRMPPKTYADAKKTLPAIETPFVQIIGGATDKVWDVLNDSHMEDGTLNRFIFSCLPDKAEYSFNPKPCAVVTKEFRDRLNKFFREGKRWDLIGYCPPGMGRVVQFGEGVEDAVIELNRGNWTPQQDERYGTLWSRYVMHVTKIACILAVGDDRLTVTMDDFEEARTFMTWSVLNTQHKVVNRVSSSNFEGLEKKLLSKLKEFGKMRPRDAYRFLRIKKREMDELVMTLLDAGEIEVIEKQSGQWLSLPKKNPA
jgi:hypothetical protein